MQINILWLLLIVPISTAIGFVLAVYYIKSQILKATGFKSFKDFEAQMRKFQKLQKDIKAGNISKVMEELSQDTRKQMEEFERRMRG